LHEQLSGKLKIQIRKLIKHKSKHTLKQREEKNRSFLLKNPVTFLYKMKGIEKQKAAIIFSEDLN
jgi:hypothetical protein